MMEEEIDLSCSYEFNKRDEYEIPTYSSWFVKGICMISFFVNVIGIISASQHYELKCYENNLIMPLALWMILMSSVFIMAMFISYLLKSSFCINNKYWFTAIPHLYTFVMCVIGILELFIQASCFNEYKEVSIVAIIVVSFNMMYLILAIVEFLYPIWY